MSRKHHAIYSDPTGAAAATSPAKRRSARAKGTESEISSSAPTSDGSPDPTIDREAVARLAYSYWAARGYIGGSAEEDWLRAEREFRKDRAARAVA